MAEIEAFLGKCQYLSDRKTRSQLVFWEPPDEFEKRRTGDCEDHAIWAWRQLDDLGYKTRFVLGRYNRWHAWVHIFINGRVYLLEATQKHKWFPNVLLSQIHRDLQKVKSWYRPAELVGSLLDGADHTLVPELAAQMEALVAHPDLLENNPATVAVCRQWDAFSERFFHAYQDLALDEVDGRSG